MCVCHSFPPYHTHASDIALPCSLYCDELVYLAGLYYAGSRFHPLASPVERDGVRQQTESPQDELSMFSVGYCNCLGNNSIKGSF